MADLSHSFGFASEEQRAKRAEVDAWDTLRLRKVREYVAQGFSCNDAEEKASADIRREIRNGPPIRT